MFEGVAGELRAVVRGSVAVITGSIESDCAVTCNTEKRRRHYAHQRREGSNPTPSNIV